MFSLGQLQQSITFIHRIYLVNLIAFTSGSMLQQKTYVSLRLRVQNQRKKWNFPLNFQTMHKLSDLYSRIFQTQSSGCASGVDLFRNFTKLKILNIWIVKYLLNCKRYLSYNFWIFQKISECWVLENLDVHLEWTTSELEFWNFQHAFLQFSEHTWNFNMLFYSFQNMLKISTCFFIVFKHSFSICFQHALQISTCSEIFNTLSNMKIWNIYSQIVTEPILEIFIKS